jgi:hypothetical protein
VDKWLVKVTDQQLLGLRADLRDLGTLVKTREGEQYLVFRDRFVALKVASHLGLQRQPSHVLNSQHLSAGYDPSVRLENGDVLVAA